MVSVRRKTAGIVAWLMLLVNASVSAIVADIAPDPGSVRQSSSLVIENDEDLSGYRFFLQSPMTVEEIKIAKGEPTIIDASGRDGAARYAKLIVIPAVEMDKLVASHLTPEEMRRALAEKRFPGAKELISHQFQVIIQEREKADWKDPVFRITKNGPSIEAVPVSGNNVAGGGRPKISFDAWDVGFGLFSRFWPVMAGGVLIAVSAFIFGFWLIIRSGKKV